MQWFIDIIKEWVISRGYLKFSFVDRGDPGPADFEIADFVKDNAWHDLDLSGIIPSGVKLVLVRFRIRCFQVGTVARFRTKGNANNRNLSQPGIQVANVYHWYDCQLIPNSDGVVEYKISVAVWDKIDATVAGWWF